MAAHPLPVIVSIATLPSRIGNMRPTLVSLLDGDLVPDRIMVIVTEYSEREESAYIIPDFLKDERFTRGKIEVVVASQDWGPGTKLLGALEHLEAQCLLVLADDDVAYKPRFLSQLVNSQSADPTSSFSYYTYRTNGLTVGQGCDGFSFHSPNLDGVRKFFDDHVVGSSLQYHDDLWISFFLFKRGIRVKPVSTPGTAELIYSETQPNDGLSSIASGELVRDKIIHDNLPRLIREGQLSRARRAMLFASNARDRLVHYASMTVFHYRRIMTNDARKNVA